MKTVIAGSRSINNINYLYKAIQESGFEITEVVSGGAKGVDKLGEQYAKAHNIKVTGFPAEWNKYGKAAGVIRNQKMAEYADALIAVWDGSSKGTLNMITNAKTSGRASHLNINDNSKSPRKLRGRVMHLHNQP